MMSLFKYAEFATYGALLRGAPPSVLQHSLLGQHRQTWKLREYHLSAPDFSQAGSDINAAPSPMPPGDPLRAHIPSGARFREFSDRMEVVGPLGTVYYQRSST